MKKQYIIVGFILLFCISILVYRISTVNISFKGISVNDINNVINNNLPNNAIMMEGETEQATLMAKSNIFIIPILIVITVSMLYFRKIKKVEINKKELFKAIILGTIIGFLLSFFHELLHAICYPKNASVSIGLILNPFYFYAFSFNAISKIRFIIMSILPFIILGIIPLLLYLYYFPRKVKIGAFLLGFCIMGLIGSTTDLLNIYNVCKKVPNNVQIIISENKIHYFN